ncbi:Assimilatory nitrite reductase (large subunit), fragment [gamma proteobacterium HdN1]|nr:Assimilatory nitrite reductase (large subunit), fragment [gamma proteobacterium HdN1]
MLPRHKALPRNRYAISPALQGITNMAYGNHSAKPRLILIGNGMAGVRTLEELLKVAPEKYDISVVGEENHGNYNRIMLSPVLAGEQRVEQIILNGEDWYRHHAIRLYKGEKAIHIDRARRTVQLASGEHLPYDKLILATGSRPTTLPIPGHQLGHLLTFREIRDVDRMLHLTKTLHHAAVIGGGLLGLEAASGLRQQGMEVTVVHSGSWLLNKQLDETAARLLQRTLESRGIRFCLNARTHAFLGDAQGNVRALEFQTGETLEADMVVTATGITPNVELAIHSGLQCSNGILVNDTLQTFDPVIYAVGECVQHRGRLFGLVAPLYEQARVCANHLAELGIARYVQKPEATKLKITGIQAFSAGDFMGEEGAETLTFHDREQGHYRKLVIRDGRLTGAVLYGDTQDGGWFFELIQQKVNIQEWRDHLIFGKDFCLATSDSSTFPAAA